MAGSTGKLGLWGVRVDGQAAEGARYRAFISYSHKDAGFGRRLHRRLEAYRMPRRLAGREGPRGPVPARLSPIFRDREELAAAHDLTSEIRAALAASKSLVVICSPAAAASPWVAREIEVFRDLHPDRPILAAIVDGEPGECFPQVLRSPVAGQATAEPLAADFRHGHDGAHLGLLKLIAGITGLGLDQLVQRDAQRRLRAVTAVTATAVAAALAMGLLTAFALDARSQAERQRAEAEGLVEFMLTDLRSRLKSVGRLDVMAAVNERALGYYADQDLKRLPAASLERRARVLHAQGEDHMNRGEPDLAIREFREASRTTAALLKAAPEDPDRIFNHAQSEFWLGYVDYDRKRYAAARPAFAAYKALADRLVAIAPADPRSQLEAGYAEGNLCSVAVRQHQAAEALRACRSALDHVERASGPRPSPDSQHDLMNRHAWLADAYREAGDLSRAQAERLIQLWMVERRIAADPDDVELKRDWVSVQLALALLGQETGRLAEAKARLQVADKTVSAMLKIDPSNHAWAKQRADVVQSLAEINNAIAEDGGGTRRSR